MLQGLLSQKRSLASCLGQTQHLAGHVDPAISVADGSQQSDAERSAEPLDGWHRNCGPLAPHGNAAHVVIADIQRVVLRYLHQLDIDAR